jgi:glycosyltransferase involved in cell wall biosynthesis
MMVRLPKPVTTTSAGDEDTTAPARGRRVLIIIPAYNEAMNLPGVLAALRDVDYDICVVDDGSTDDTAEVARRHGALALRSPLNLGIGGAVQTGYLRAFEEGYAAAVQLDGDGQHDPAFLDALLTPVLGGEADLVIGSRFLDGRGYLSSGVRRAGITYLSWLLRFRCAVRVTDPTSGFRAAGQRTIELFARMYPPDYPEPESIVIAREAGLRVAEVPVVMRERKHGKSSIGALATLYYLVKVSLALFLSPRPPTASRGVPC